jgi:hypothetical protein
MNKKAAVSFPDMGLTMNFQYCRARDLNTARPGQKVPDFMLGSAGRY